MTLAQSSMSTITDNANWIHGIKKLSVNTNRKLLQQHITEKGGKRETMKDIHNVGTSKKKENALIAQSNLQVIADYLKTQQNIVTEYATDEKDNILSGIFIQDIEMQQVFEKYPEVILVDGTHKTNNLDFPFYAFGVIDGNGETEIVAATLVAQEDEQSIKKMFPIFKSRNDKWSDIQVVMLTKTWLTEMSLPVK